MVTIFDRDTLLDLTVNAIPLGIILFFGVGYLIFDPFSHLGLFGTLIMIGLHVVPFVGLLVLTYVSGKAIAGDEKRSDVYFQGQAAVEDAPTREEAEADYFGEEQEGAGPPPHEDDVSAPDEASEANEPARTNDDGQPAGANTADEVADADGDGATDEGTGSERTAAKPAAGDDETGNR